MKLQQQLGSMRIPISRRHMQRRSPHVVLVEKGSLVQQQLHDLVVAVLTRQMQGSQSLAVCLVDDVRAYGGS